MWQDGAETLENSVAAVLEHLVAEFQGDEISYWHMLGTAFRIEGGTHPLFVTAAHVTNERDVVMEVSRASRTSDEEGRDTTKLPAERQELAIIGGSSPAIGGAEVIDTVPQLDLSILHTSEEGSQLDPVTFSDRSVLDTGEPVAIMGYPLQERPEITDGGGRLTAVRRFAAGWLSGSS